MIPTAEEFIINREVKQGFLLTNNTEELNDIVKSHIEFAKLHVKVALKQASENIPGFGSSTDIPDWEEVEKEVLNAYPLENIK